MTINSEIREEENDLKKIFYMFKKKKFDGETGQVVKNSSYQLAINITMKIAAMIFTIIMARILAPDRMGLYSLALSTIGFLTVFSDLGIGSALMTFVSKSLGKKDNSKAKAYAKILFKWKIRLLILSVSILVLSSYFIANFYYNKPIFFALLAGIFYIPLGGLVGFLDNMFKASNDFKRPFYKEIIFQASRIIIIPILSIIFINLGFSNQKVVFVVLMGLNISYFLSLFYMVIKAKKRIGYLQSAASELTKAEKKNLILFITPLSVMALSGIFFGYIDTLMLGHYVSERFIAYYGAAFTLITSAIAIISFISTGIFPILARETGKRFDNLFKKSRNFTIIMSVFAGVFTYLVADIIIRIAYGQDYFPAGIILKYFSVLIIVIAVSSIYDGYFVIKEKTKTLMWVIIISTIINVVLNAVGITYGIKTYGEMGGVYGACFATIISRIFYLISLVVLKSHFKNN